MYRVIIAIGIAAAVCLVAGCGSGGEETASASVTKAEFIKQADAVCAKFSKKGKAAFASWKEKFPGGYAEAQRHLDEAFKELTASILQEQAKELKALTPPENDEANIAQMLGSLEDGSEEIAADGMKALRRPSGVTSFEDEAKAYGLKRCPNP